MSRRHGLSLISTTMNAPGSNLHSQQRRRARRREMEGQRDRSSTEATLLGLTSSPQYWPRKWLSHDALFEIVRAIHRPQHLIAPNPLVEKAHQGFKGVHASHPVVESQECSGAFLPWCEPYVTGWPDPTHVRQPHGHVVGTTATSGAATARRRSHVNRHAPNRRASTTYSAS